MLHGRSMAMGILPHAGLTAMIFAHTHAWQTRPALRACAAAMQDFGKLATFLPRRSTRDCIAFYYRTQKEDEWSGVKRKLKLKKRRLQSEYNRTYLGFGGRMSDPAQAAGEILP